jgi:two-component system, LytTR family, response regulator
MNLRCITVDDEPLSLSKIGSFIERVPYLNLVASFGSALEAMAFLKEHPADLIFLDIQMDHLTGIQMLEVLQPRPAVILTTAYDQYALRGYELDVTDYLLKPFSFERFLQAVEKVAARQGGGEPAAAATSNRFIFLKTEYRLEKVNFADILYAESRGDYVYVSTTQGRILTLMRMKNLEDQLPPSEFLRVHKSWLAGIRHIDAIEYGKIRIRDAVIPIGDTYRDGVWKRLSL